MFDSASAKADLVTLTHEADSARGVGNTTSSKSRDDVGRSGGQGAAMSGRKMICESQLVSEVGVWGLVMEGDDRPPLTAHQAFKSGSKRVGRVSNVAVRFQQEITMVFVCFTYECLWSHSTGVLELAHRLPFYRC